MTKPTSTSKKPRKQHTSEFRNEALKLAEQIGVAAAARELSLYGSQLYTWRSQQQQIMASSERESELAAEHDRLKRQLVEQTEELAILQKAATYFAKRQQCRLICDAAVRKAFTEAKWRYAAPRLARELPEYNIKTIAASLRRQGLRAKASRKSSPVSYREHGLPVSENLLKQEFSASGPNQKWA